MSGFKYIISTLLLCASWCVPAVVNAQDNVLTGTITVKSGDTYPYSLVLSAAGNIVKGTSTTRQDSTEYKLKFRGIINRDKKMLIVSETSVVGKLKDTGEMCFVNAVLKWKIRKGNYLFTGYFAGKDSKGGICSEGTIEMQAPVDKCPVLKEEEKKAAKPVDSVAVALEIPTDTNKITEGSDKLLGWGSTTCILEVRDGGITDGDVITVLVNGKELLADYTLTATARQLKFPLTERVTTVTVVAGTEGINPPNTVELVLIDGATIHKLTAFNKKGGKANVVIVRR